MTPTRHTHTQRTLLQAILSIGMLDGFRLGTPRAVIGPWHNGLISSPVSAKAFLPGPARGHNSKRRKQRLRGRRKAAAREVRDV